MTFEIRVDYRAPSKEWLFLGAGWEPARDVRGVYITDPAAELVLDNRILSRERPSLLRLTFSMAERADVDAIMVRASGIFGSKQTIIQKVKQTAMEIHPLFSNVFGHPLVIILQPAFGPNKELPVSPGTL